jgi:hypothetical protein
MIEAMEPRGTLYSIEDDLTEDWLARLADAGVTELESYLEKHLAFLSFLDEG